jgi:hypothetical protein
MLLIMAGVGVAAALATMMMAPIGGGRDCSSTPRSNTEIFQGVIYGCERLAPSAKGRGVIHWVRIDLNAPIL